MNISKINDDDLSMSFLFLPFGTLRPIFWCPVQTFWIDANFSFFHGLFVLFDCFEIYTNYILTFVVIN